VKGRMVVIMKLKEPIEKFRDPGVSHSSRYRAVNDLEEAMTVCLKYIQDHCIQVKEWDGGHVFLSTCQIATIDFYGNIRKEGESGYHRFL